MVSSTTCTFSFTLYLTSYSLPSILCLSHAVLITVLKCPSPLPQHVLHLRMEMPFLLPQFNLLSPPSGFYSNHNPYLDSLSPFLFCFSLSLHSLSAHSLSHTDMHMHTYMYIFMCLPVIDREPHAVQDCCLKCALIYPQCQDSAGLSEVLKKYLLNKSSGSSASVGSHQLYLEFSVLA